MLPAPPRSRTGSASARSYDTAARALDTTAYGIRVRPRRRPFAMGHLSLSTFEWAHIRTQPVEIVRRVSTLAHEPPESGYRDRVLLRAGVV
eukprot:1948804-Prymnesium_polylepis.1